MKTLVINRQSLVLHTITDIAREIGQPANLVWYAIAKQQSPAFREPSFRLGRRDYYTAAEFPDAVAALKAHFQRV